MFHQWTEELKNWYLTKQHQTSFYYLLGGSPRRRVGLCECGLSSLKEKVDIRPKP